MPLEPPPPDEPLDVHPAALSPAQRDLAAALVTGQFAGFVMLFSMMLAHALVLSGDAWMPLRVIGAIVAGHSDLGADPNLLLVGFVVHQFVLTVVWSLVFGVLVRVTNLRHGFGVAALGPLVGMASQLVDVDIVMPPLIAQADWTMELLGPKSWFWHLIFGVSLCSFPRFRAWLFPEDEP